MPDPRVIITQTIKFSLITTGSNCDFNKHVNCHKYLKSLPYRLTIFMACTFQVSDDVVLINRIYLLPFYNYKLHYINCILRSGICLPLACCLSCNIVPVFIR